MVFGSPQFMAGGAGCPLRFMSAYLKGVRDYNDGFIKGKGKDEVIDIMTKHTALKDPALWGKSTSPASIRMVRCSSTILKSNMTHTRQMVLFVERST